MIIGFSWQWLLLYGMVSIVSVRVQDIEARAPLVVKQKATNSRLIHESIYEGSVISFYSKK